jgi:hypothetical protein
MHFVARSKDEHRLARSGSTIAAQEPAQHSDAVSGIIVVLLRTDFIASRSHKPLENLFALESSFAPSTSASFTLTPVPEPDACALFGTGLMALIGDVRCRIHD